MTSSRQVALRLTQVMLRRQVNLLYILEADQASLQGKLLYILKAGCITSLTQVMLSHQVNLCTGICLRLVALRLQGRLRYVIEADCPSS